MKFIYTLLAILMVGEVACQRKQEQMSDGSNQSTFFATPEEAAIKAKSDLLAVLRSAKNVSLALNQSALERSQPAKPAKHYQISFDKLLSADSRAFATLKDNEIATVVPLVADNNVVTIVEIGKTEKGWRVASLADKNVSDDLNTIRAVIPDSLQAEITIYDLPHSAVKVYEAPGGMLHTSYPGFTLPEGVSAERLLVVLKRDAAEFQRQHGEALKARKLVR